MKKEIKKKRVDRREGKKSRMAKWQYNITRRNGGRKRENFYFLAIATY